MNIESALHRAEELKQARHLGDSLNDDEEYLIILASEVKKLRRKGGKT